MVPNRLSRLVVFLLVSALQAGPAISAGGNLESLGGLKAGVRVVVDALDASLRRGDFNDEKIRTEVERELRKAGVPLASEAGANLRVRVKTFLVRGAGLYAYSVGIGLEQEVCLLRDRAVHTTAETWSHETVGSAMSGNFEKAVMGNLARLVEVFASDYSVMNPP
jgi:hypothetical protein